MNPQEIADGGDDQSEDAGGFVFEIVIHTLLGFSANVAYTVAMKFSGHPLSIVLDMECQSFVLCF